MPSPGFPESMIIPAVLLFVAVLWGAIGLAVAILRLRLRRPEAGDVQNAPKREQAGAPASRGTRLAAVLLDMVLAAPLVFIAQEWGYANTSTVDPVGATALIGFLILQNVQVYLVASSGQTIGKRVMRIRVVDARTGEHTGWFRVVVLRVYANRILVAATLLLYGLVDALFIFRGDRRTVHDRLARTRVDRVSA